MTAEELQNAIDKTSQHMRRLGLASRDYYTFRDHLECLLIIQKQRAAYLEMEIESND